MYKSICQNIKMRISYEINHKQIIQNKHFNFKHKFSCFNTPLFTYEKIQFYEANYDSTWNILEMDLKFDKESADRHSVSVSHDTETEWRSAINPHKSTGPGIYTIGQLVGYKHATMMRDYQTRLLNLPLVKNEELQGLFLSSDHQS